MTDDSVRIRPWRPEDRALGLALFDSNVPRFFAVLCWGMVRGDRHRAGLGWVLLTERLDRIAADPAFRSAAIETTQHSRSFFARHGFVQTRQVPDGFAPGMDLVEMTLDLDGYRRSRKG